MKDYNGVISSIREGAQRTGETVYLSVAEADGVVIPRESLVAIGQVNDIRHYHTGGQTPLFDAVGYLIDQFESLPAYSIDKDTTFVINVVTDGHENASRMWTAQRLGAAIKRLMATDKWSFSFRIPKNGSGRYTLQSAGVPAESILEWDTTEEGMRESSHRTQEAFTGYLSAKAMYGTASPQAAATRQAFYATNLSTVKAADLQKNLWDVTSQVKFFPVGPGDDHKQIQTFAEEKVGKLSLGAAFYQLTKPEKNLYDGRQIAIRDKRTAKVYAGTNARTLLGLPATGTVKVTPGDHGNFDIFVQSRSTNRYMVGGTQLMYWANAAQGGPATNQAQIDSAKAKAATPMQAAANQFSNAVQNAYAKAQAPVKQSMPYQGALPKHVIQPPWNASRDNHKTMKRDNNGRFIRAA